MLANHSQIGFAARAAFCALVLSAGILTGPFARDQKKVNSLATDSAGQTAVEHSQFYCNLNALTPGERARHAQLSSQLAAARIETEELPDGYAFRLQKGVSITDLAEWVSLETKCCPFFDFEIELGRNNGSLWLKLRGAEGVKQFIVSDFHLR